MKNNEGQWLTVSIVASFIVLCIMMFFANYDTSSYVEDLTVPDYNVSSSELTYVIECEVYNKYSPSFADTLATGGNFSYNMNIIVTEDVYNDLNVGDNLSSSHFREVVSDAADIPNNAYVRIMGKVMR